MKQQAYETTYAICETLTLSPIVANSGFLIHEHTVFSHFEYSHPPVHMETIIIPYNLNSVISAIP